MASYIRNLVCLVPRRVVGALFVILTSAWMSSVAFTASGPQPAQNPHEKGATYYSLEARTARLTTRFADGQETVADRDVAGAVRAAPTDRSGNELARRQHRASVTLDAASRQTSAKNDHDVVSLVTEWADRLTATLSRQTYPRREAGPTPVPVQIVPGGQPRRADPHKKGATYYALEAQTVRLTTHFRNGHVVTAERGIVGEAKAALTDRAGNAIAALRTPHIDGLHDAITYEPAVGAPLQAVSDPTVKLTLDWATRQAYTFAQDGTADLVWDKGAMRPRKAAIRDVDADATKVVTEWANGLSATLTRETYSRRQLAPGIVVEGPALVSQLRLNGVDVGFGVWFINEHIYAYTLPTVSPSAIVISNTQLKEYGGWGFSPDTTWVSLQTLGMYQFKSEAKAKGFIAKAGVDCGPTAKPNRLARFSQFLFPTVLANDAGCDRLHWYDGTILRMCCDNHDRCYAQNGCTERSWWLLGSWSCDACNIAAVWCFEVVSTAPCVLMRLAC